MPSRNLLPLSEALFVRASHHRLDGAGTFIIRHIVNHQQEETWRAFGRNHISWNGHRIGIIRRPTCCYPNRLLIINDCCFGLYISEITQNTVFWNLFHRWGISEKDGVSFISVNDLPPVHPPDEGSTLDHLAFFSVRLPWGLPSYVLHMYFAFRPSSDLSFFLLGFLWGLPCHWSLFSSALFACQPSIVQPILWDTVVRGALMFLFLASSDLKNPSSAWPKGWSDN